MTLLEPIVPAAIALMFFALAFNLIVGTAKSNATGPAAFLASAGGPWPWISGFTVCGSMAMARALTHLF